MAGIEDQRHRLGPLGCDLGREITDLAVEILLRKIDDDRHIETGLSQHLGHGIGVIRRVRQWHHGPIGRLSDHQREPAAFGQSRRQPGKQTARKQGGCESVAEHDDLQSGRGMSVGRRRLRPGSLRRATPPRRRRDIRRKAQWFRRVQTRDPPILAVIAD